MKDGATYTEALDSLLDETTTGTKILSQESTDPSGYEATIGAIENLASYAHVAISTATLKGLEQPISLDLNGSSTLSSTSETYRTTTTTTVTFTTTTSHGTPTTFGDGGGGDGIAQRARLQVAARDRRGWLRGGDAAGGPRGPRTTGCLRDRRRFFPKLIWLR